MSTMINVGEVLDILNVFAMMEQFINCQDTHVSIQIVLNLLLEKVQPENLSSVSGYQSEDTDLNPRMKIKRFLLP